jgi:FixJ family two-component response regulator
MFSSSLNWEKCMPMEKEIKRVLVVDDEQAMCAMVTRFLRTSGYDSESTTDPAKALELLKLGSFELVISDIKMPGMDGIQLLSEILRIDPIPHTIIMTGHTDAYTFSDIIKAGAADFISKPFRLSELKAKIERIDGERKMKRELQEMNIAIGVLLQRAQKEKENLGAVVSSNIKELVLPYVEKLKNAHLKVEYKAYVEILDKNLADICSPFLNNLSPEHAHISSMEVQVANLIKAGKRNKEIASILGISLNTVTTHRYRLRTKLGLKGEKINLRSYLNSTNF